MRPQYISLIRTIFFILFLTILREPFGVLSRQSEFNFVTPELTAKELANKSNSNGSENPKAREIAERFLELSGGRTAWKSVKSLHLLAVNRSKSARLPYLFEFWIDLANPRTLTRILNQDMNRLRGYRGDSGWSIKEEEAGLQTNAFSKERLGFERILWEGAYSRNLWRLAIEDSTLVLRFGKENRLEFHNKNGGLTAWFIFDEKGYPERFGFPGDDQGLKLEFFESFGLYKIPRKGVTPEGVDFETLYFRGSDKALEVPLNPPNDLSDFNP